ncbi:hypothetical protein ABGB07_10265 [Micromonosporaceae bacterium B7E4]
MTSGHEPCRRTPATAATARAELRAGEPAVLYVSPDTVTFDGKCTGEVAGSPITVIEASDTFTFFSGGRTWAARYEIRAEHSGSGQLTCIAGTGRGAPLLAVGDRPDNPHLVRRLAGTVAVGACVAGLGLALGGAIALAVRKRRRAHRSSPGPGTA